MGDEVSMGLRLDFSIYLPQFGQDSDCNMRPVVVIMEKNSLK